MVVKFRVIASGSNGNSAYFSTPEGTIIIDAGVTTKRIIKVFKEDMIPLNNIVGVLISHSHGDHCLGLPVLLRTINTEVFCSMGTFNGMNNKFKTDYGEKWEKMNSRIFIFSLNTEFSLFPFKILPIPTVHDTEESAAFKITYKNVSISIITDTGEILTEHIQAMKESHIILLEANYSRMALNNSNRPPFLKKRIVNYHLSNFQATNLLNILLNSEIKVFYFGHLSEECNSPRRIKSLIEEWSEEHSPPWEFIICDRNKSNNLIRISDEYINKPERAATLFFRGVALYHLDRHEEAIQKYQQANEIRPEHAPILMNWGVALYQLDCPEEAIQKYQQANEIRPEHAPTLMNWGVALYQLDCPEEAIQKYQQANEIRPEHAITLANCGRALKMLKRFKEANKMYQRAATAAQAAGDISQARKYEKRVKDINYKDHQPLHSRFFNRLRQK